MTATNIKLSTEIDEMQIPVPVSSMKHFRQAQLTRFQHLPRNSSPLATFQNSYSFDGQPMDESRSTSEETGASTLEEDDGRVVDKSEHKKAEGNGALVDMIPLFVHGEHVLIFNSRHMKELTIRHGITGQLAGTLPLAPQQNALLGFPWRLTIYEVMWLLENKHCVLIDSEDTIENVFVGQWLGDATLQEKLSSHLQVKLDKWREEKQKEIEEQMKKLNIIKKDHRAMKPLDNAMLASSASMPDLQQVLNDDQRKRDELAERKRKDREMHDKSKRNNIVFMETPNDDLKFMEVHIKDKSACLLQKMIDNEVEDVNQIWRNYQIYKYLKDNLGYYLLPGMRFGGTFVSYPGDPLRYHAHQIVDTKHYYNDDIGLFRMSNRGRLATGVRKVWVVGGDRNVDPAQNSKINITDTIIHGAVPFTDSDMVCFSIEWAGF